MLKRPTLFIVGAGASVPYGFSTGCGQLNAARLLSPDQIVAMIAPVRRPQAALLATQLSLTGEDSIDAMLPADSPLLPAAKAYIARDPFKEHQRVTPRPEVEQHWYRTRSSSAFRQNSGQKVDTG